MSKPFWKSRVFWWNVLTAAADVTSVLPLPPGTVVIVSSLVNVGLRFATTTPITVTDQS